jgi:transglutaminase-like putative cysteine protease
MSALAGPRPRQLELVCFAALAALASLQWASLVANPPAARVTLAVALATGAGAGLAAIARLRLTRPARWALAAAACLVALCLALVVVGLPARLLLPGNWDELSSNLDRSLNGLTDVPVPYAGADTWTRLVILLAAPLVVGAAAFAAFWPTRRRAAGRIGALVLLVALYLVAVAWARPGRQLAGGALLLILVCAWLWLPGTQAGRRPAATLAVAAAALVALPATAIVDPGRALIDYRHWDLLSANGVSFRWDQSYGPLSWPQKGTLLLEIASDKIHYWKATNLDSFDGVRWMRSAAPNTEPALGEPLKFHPKGTDPSPDAEWVDRINLDDRGLSSDVAVGAGTILALRRTEATPSPDGVWEMDHELRPGNSYTALVYDPKPSVPEMRAAGTDFPTEASRYVSFSLAGGPGGPISVDVPFWGRSGPASISDEVGGSPYEPMYSLARTLAAGAATPYDAVQRIELYLRAHYTYRQDVPNHAYPLPAFLSEDRAGYCQQFSGAMALMLRMLGIPSRVATGFAPGGRDPEHGGFLVDDTDAHDWVEVYFPGIGWATFEPTPPGAPAASQLDDTGLVVSGTTPSVDKVSLQDVPDPSGRNPRAPVPVTGATGPQSATGSGPGTPTLLGFAATAAGLALLAVYGYRSRRRSRLDPTDLAEAELRELDRALTRLGPPLPPGTTLLRAEERLAQFAGPGAARYAARLRNRRYRDPGAAPPGVSERRALRRALLRAAGRRRALRVLLAIPPGGPAIRRRRALVRPAGGRLPVRGRGILEDAGIARKCEGC